MIYFLKPIEERLFDQYQKTTCWSSPKITKELKIYWPHRPDEWQFVEQYENFCPSCKIVVIRASEENYLKHPFCPDCVINKLYTK